MTLCIISTDVHLISRFLITPITEIYPLYPLNLVTYKLFKVKVQLYWLNLNSIASSTSRISLPYVHFVIQSFSFWLQRGNTILLFSRERTNNSKAQITNKDSETKNQFLHFYHIYLSHFIKTLTILYLFNNRIGDKGAQCLGEGLQKNTVRQTISFFISIIFIFHISYRHSPNSASLQIKSAIKVHNVLVKACKRTQWDKQTVSSFLSYSTFAFHIDTHRTLPLWKSNRR